MGKTVKWMHYDRLGNLMNKSGTAGTSTDTYYQDAYGNVLSSITTGAWASSSSGRHLTTKEIDGDVPLYYFWQRWYEPTTGRFISRAPLPYYLEHPYTYALDNPIRIVDSLGLTYYDFGGSVPLIPDPLLGLGVSFGVQCDPCNGQVAFYFGAYFGTPSVSGTGAPRQNIAPGGSVGLGGFFPNLLGGQGGICGIGTPNWGGFIEGGVGAPGGGVQIINVIDITKVITSVVDWLADWIYRQTSDQNCECEQGN